MDPLALLSNLHGDGPATLHRLRRHGCDTLSGLLGTGAAELAPLLGWEEARAERFLREADALQRRLGEGILDREEAAPTPGPTPEPTALASEPEEEEAEVEADEEEEEQPLASPQDEAEMRQRVLEHWRSLDATDPVRPEVLVPHTPSAPLEPPGTPLGQVTLDGLDGGRVARLQAAGITTLEELAEVDDLDLHLASGLSFTLASRLAFLARRAVAARAGRDSAEPAADSLGAAGPFA